jgi:hypothetical protein
LTTVVAVADVVVKGVDGEASGLAGFVKPELLLLRVMLEFIFIVSDVALEPRWELELSLPLNALSLLSDLSLWVWYINVPFSLEPSVMANLLRCVAESAIFSG